MGESFNQARGGSFGAGFASAAISSGMEGVSTGYLETNVMMHATIGGTTSVIMGGKFKNGAITSAFVYLYNEQKHGVKTRTLFDDIIDYFSTPSSLFCPTCIHPDAYLVLPEWKLIQISQSGGDYDFKTNQFEFLKIEATKIAGGLAASMTIDVSSDRINPSQSYVGSSVPYRVRLMDGQSAIFRVAPIQKGESVNWNITDITMGYQTSDNQIMTINIYGGTLRE